MDRKQTFTKVRGVWWGYNRDQSNAIRNHLRDVKKYGEIVGGTAN